MSEPGTHNSGIRTTLVLKLHPSQYPNMSTKMMAIVGYILDEVFTNPVISEMLITSDGHVLAWHGDEIGHDHHMGHVDDLQGNWRRLLDVAGLTEAERAMSMLLFREKFPNA